MKKGQRPSAHHRTSKRGKRFPVNQSIIKALKPMKNKDFKKIMNQYSDPDGDGVISKYDCYPFDKNKQDEDIDYLIKTKQGEKIRILNYKIKTKGGYEMELNPDEYQQYIRNLHQDNVSMEYMPERITRLKGRDWMISD